MEPSSSDIQSETFSPLTLGQEPARPMEVPCKWIIPFYKPYTVYTHQGSFWTFWSCCVAFQWKIGQKTKYSPKNHVNQPNADVDRSDGSVFFWLLQRCKTRFEIWSLLVSRGDPAFCTRKGMLYCSQPSLYCCIAVLLYCCIAVLLYCCIALLLSAFPLLLSSICQCK